MVGLDGWLINLVSYYECLFYDIDFYLTNIFIFIINFVLILRGLQPGDNKHPQKVNGNSQIFWGYEHS